MRPRLSPDFTLCSQIGVLPPQRGSPLGFFTEADFVGFLLRLGRLRLGRDRRLRRRRRLGRDDRWGVFLFLLLGVPASGGSRRTGEAAAVGTVTSPIHRARAAQRPRQAPVRKKLAGSHSSAPVLEQASGARAGAPRPRRGRQIHPPGPFRDKSLTRGARAPQTCEVLAGPARRLIYRHGTIERRHPGRRTAPHSARRDALAVGRPARVEAPAAGRVGRVGRTRSRAVATFSRQARRWQGRLWRRPPARPRHPALMCSRRPWTHGPRTCSSRRSSPTAQKLRATTASPLVSADDQGRRARPRRGQPA